MSTDTKKAVVEDCSLTASERVTPDIQVTFYHVKAQMLTSGYSDDIYMIEIIKPEGLRHLMPKDGTLMEHGEFFFDSTEDVPKGTELEVEITEIGDSFSYGGQQVRIEIIYPHEDTPSQAQYAFFINDKRCGTAYLKGQAVQQARAIIDQNL
jgi:hypothetical protein